MVIGDRKSPPETADFCKSVPHYPCAYLDIPAQQEYLSRFPELWSHLRFDSVGRRNIGILLAYENGADVVITIDDDNFVMDQDFVGFPRGGRLGARVTHLPLDFRLVQCLFFPRSGPRGGVLSPRIPAEDALD